jgi:protein-tyrosine-phosphatase
MGTPLFICHANCCRSVLACYLYRHLGNSPALSAAMEAGECINDRALAMSHRWGIDAHEHCPGQLTRRLCDQAANIFLMAPAHLRRLLAEFGPDLAAKAYLFADPFSLPRSFNNGEYKVYDPSFDRRPVRELVQEFSWMRERVLEIRLALLGEGRLLMPAATYLPLIDTVDLRSV